MEVPIGSMDSPQDSRRGSVASLRNQILQENKRMNEGHTGACHAVRLYCMKTAFYSLTVLRSTTVAQVAAAVASVASTLLCIHFEWRSNLHPSLFLMVVVMPLTFAVNAAYARREKALEELSLLRASSLSLFLLHREWKHFVDPEHPGQHVETVSRVLHRLFERIRQYTNCHLPCAKRERLQEIYRIHGELSALNELLHTCKVPPPMITRPIHWHHLQVHAFERLRLIVDYRTPTVIRAYTYITIFVISTFLSPYFAYVADQSSKSCALYACITVSLTLGYLNNVQAMLENPFDGDQDDVNMQELETWVHDATSWGVFQRQEANGLGPSNHTTWSPTNSRPSFMPPAMPPPTTNNNNNNNKYPSSTTQPEPPQQTEETPHTPADAPSSPSRVLPALLLIDTLADPAFHQEIISGESEGDTDASDDASPLHSPAASAPEGVVGVPPTGGGPAPPKKRSPRNRKGSKSKRSTSPPSPTANPPGNPVARRPPKREAPEAMKVPPNPNMSPRALGAAHESARRASFGYGFNDSLAKSSALSSTVTGAFAKKRPAVPPGV